MFPNFCAGVVYMVQLLLLGTLLACPPLRVAVGPFFLPQPGEGPSEQSMDNGISRLIINYFILFALLWVLPTL